MSHSAIRKTEHQKIELWKWLLTHRKCGRNWDIISSVIKQTGYRNNEICLRSWWMCCRRGVKGGMQDSWIHPLDRQSPRLHIRPEIRTWIHAVQARLNQIVELQDKRSRLRKQRGVASNVFDIRPDNTAYRWLGGRRTPDWNVSVTKD